MTTAEMTALLCGEIRKLTTEVRKLRRVVEGATVVQAVESDPGCSHPDEARIQFSAQGVEEWECSMCSFHYGPVTDPTEVARA